MTRPDSAHATGADLLALHTLRCIGFASLERVAAASGLPAPDAESELIDLAVAGLVTRVAGEFGGWGLTEAGRVADAERIAGELETAGTRTVVAEAYDGFLVLNPELLDLCGAWQTRTVDGAVTANDHADPTYDARVLDRLADLTGAPRSPARGCSRPCCGSGGTGSGSATPWLGPGRARWTR